MTTQRPYQLNDQELAARIDEMVTRTFDDLSSEFLLLPLGQSFVDYRNFQEAYEVCKQKTGGFKKLSPETVRSALRENSLVLGVLRSILGLTAPEWAELARVELDSDINQGAARQIDKNCRNRDYYSTLAARGTATKTLKRIDALIEVAIH